MRQAPAISPAAARPIIPAIPVATDSDTRPGDGNAPYPRIPPTARPTRYHLLSPTARQGGHTPQYHPPYHLWQPPRLSTLPPTATTGRGIATPLSAHFPNCRADQMPSALPHSAAKGLYAAVSPTISPAAAHPAYLYFRRQRHPARATPCKPKGSVLPPCTGPCSRTRQAKGVSICTLGVRSRVPPVKATLPPKKRLALFPSQLSFKEQWLWQSAKKGGDAETCPRPPAARAKLAPFSRPAAKSARSASHTKPFAHASAPVLGRRAVNPTSAQRPFSNALSRPAAANSSAPNGAPHFPARSGCPQQKSRANPAGAELPPSRTGEVLPAALTLPARPLII